MSVNEDSEVIPLLAVDDSSESFINKVVDKVVQKATPVVAGEVVCESAAMEFTDDSILESKVVEGTSMKSAQVVCEVSGREVCSKLEFLVDGGLFAKEDEVSTAEEAAVSE